MASVPDSVIPSTPVAADPELTVRDPNSSKTGCSKDDPIEISSDSESDYDDLDSGSDTSFSQIDELLRRPAKRENVESGSVGSAGEYLSSLSAEMGCYADIPK